MSSAGHVLDMIIRMRQNRAIKTSNKQKFRSNNREASHSDKAALRYKKVSKEKLEKIKGKIRLKAGLERRKEILVISIFLVLVIIIAYTYMT
ncbi:hypothetical protein ACXR6G_03205 [Ancylomarina sp. YFZ004]